MTGRRLLLSLALPLLLASCGFGGDGPIVSDGDRARGGETHAQLLAEFGGAYAGDEAPYLAQLGQRIAAEAGLEGQCRFTLVNSDVVNAFAVPGCYIYVTRGLMGIVNSEAELAAVLAHELGHIVGRHSQRQQQRSLWRQLGVIAVGMVTGSEQLTRIAGAAAGLFTLRYSRSHEYEADEHGVRYLRQAGYDPFAAVDMLEALRRQEAYMVRTRGRDEARSIPEWARTHPLTGNRAERTAQLAAATGVARGALPEHELPFFQAVDGLLYGDDPEQGFVIGRSFAHPVMGIAFDAPDGFTLTNSPQAILIEGPQGMRGEFGGGAMPPGGLEAYSGSVLRQLLGDAAVEAEARPARINGLDALVTQGVVRTSQGAVGITFAAYDAGRRAYHFVLLSGPGAASDAGVSELLGSFRTIGAGEARALRPRRIAAIAARPGDTLEALSQRMATSDKLDHFLMLNGREAGQPLKPGEPLKIVVFGGGG